MQESKDDRPKDESKGGAAPPADPPTPPAAPKSALVALEHRTAPEWAVELGHVDPPPEKAPAVPGEQVLPGSRPGQPSQTRKAWIDETTAARMGWGTKLAIDELMTREGYEKAVAATLAVPVGEHHRDLKAEEAKAAAEAKAAKEKAR